MNVYDYQCNKCDKKANETHILEKINRLPMKYEGKKITKANDPEHLEQMTHEGWRYR